MLCWAGHKGFLPEALICLCVSCSPSWMCEVCETTEHSVWLCLTCGHTGCGKGDKSSKKHALAHHMANPSHCIALDMNQHGVHCYACDDWVLNDNAKHEITHARTQLQDFQNGTNLHDFHSGSSTRSGAIIRSQKQFEQVMPFAGTPAATGARHAGATPLAAAVAATSSSFWASGGLSSVAGSSARPASGIPGQLPADEVPVSSHPAKAGPDAEMSQVSERDMVDTALRFERHNLLARCFTSWVRARAAPSGDAKVRF